MQSPYPRQLPTEQDFHESTWRKYAWFMFFGSLLAWGLLALTSTSPRHSTVVWGLVPGGFLVLSGLIGIFLAPTLSLRTSAPVWWRVVRSASAVALHLLSRAYALFRLGISLLD